jgi:hypothetical protein
MDCVLTGVVIFDLLVPPFKPEWDDPLLSMLSSEDESFDFGTSILYRLSGIK